MSAVEALRMAQENGIRLGIAGADLILDAEREPAPTVLEAIRRHKADIVALIAADHDAWTAEDWQAFFDERTRIAEFDGGQTREQAEARAFECCVIEWLNRHPCQSDPGRCVLCGKPDRSGHTVVPFGTESHGHAWLHPECWTPWHEQRLGLATCALAAFGIRSRLLPPALTTAMLGLASHPERNLPKKDPVLRIFGAASLQKTVIGILGLQGRS